MKYKILIIFILTSIFARESTPAEFWSSYSQEEKIADEYRSKEVGYNLKIIALHMDAFYTNSDNLNIPVLEALRVVSLMQDGEQRTANVRLLRAQQKYQ